MFKQILLALFFLPYLAFAQQAKLQGSITDGKAGHSMSYVNIALPKIQSGTISDEEGVFDIDITGLSGSDSVIFSYLGYEEIHTTIAALQQQPVVIMQPVDFSIGEVIIKPVDALGLIKQARSQIKDNYPTNYSNTHIIYKDFSKRSGHQSHYYFFDLNMYLASYAGTNFDAGWKVNKHELYDKKHELTPSMNPTMLLKVNQLEKFLDDKELEKNEYKWLNKTTYNGEDLDVIAFTHKPDKRSNYIHIDGKIYIAADSKAFRFIELHVYNLKSKRFMLVAKMDSLNINMKIAFKKIDNTNVLDYISQTTYAKGTLFGKQENLQYSTTARSVGQELNIPANMIYKENDVKRIFKEEKQQNIDELKQDPDMW